MIKINLLPIRAAKKKETAVQQLTILGVVLALVLVVCLSFYVFKRVQISTTKTDITAANAKITELKTKIGKIEEIKSLKEQVKKKLDILTLLRKNKKGPAQRLATLSSIVPDQLWLTAYSEKGSDVKISGFAFTEDLIAQFMRSLESSPDFMGVELIVSEQTEVAGNKIKKFDLSCKLKTAAVPGAPVTPSK